MKKFALGCGALIVVAIIVLAIAAIWGVGVNNRLVQLSQKVDQQWSQVENDYQRRADLIPNLMRTVQGSAQFEKSTLEEVTKARASVGQVKVDPNHAPTDPQQLAAFEQAQGQLGNALSRLLVVSERYPDLKSTQGFRDFQASLEGTENRIAVSRRDFNQAVNDYNVAVKSFPSGMIASFRGFAEKPYFKAVAGSEVAPKVEFNFNNTNAK